MAITLDGTTGITTPGVVNTAAETIATTLAVTGVTTLQAGTAALPALTTSGDTNTGIFFPAADTIAFTEGGAESMRIDSSGNLGLGVTPSPSSFTGKAIDFSIYGTINSLDDGTKGNFQVGYNYYQTNNSTFNYKVNDLASMYRQRAGVHSWYTAPSGTATNAITFTQALTLNTNGALALQGGSTSATGVGITFPATQSASTDANTLDDYEEGTWTPTLANIGTGTYATNTGTYTKIGNRVYLSVILDINTVGTASGNLQINGFPFTTVSAEPNRSVSGNLLCGAWSSDGTPNIVFMSSNATAATIQDNQGNTVRTHANMGTGTFRFDISYQTA